MADKGFDKLHIVKAFHKKDTICARLIQFLRHMCNIDILHIQLVSIFLYF